MILRLEKDRKTKRRLLTASRKKNRRRPGSWKRSSWNGSVCRRSFGYAAAVFRKMCRQRWKRSGKSSATEWWRI
ncbi:MAG: hypothetical protein ACLRT5_01200 [Lachnospiraceae bacterium]